MSEFLRKLKRLIAHRGRPAKIYSDNGKTFVGAVKWLKQVMHDEKLQDYLALSMRTLSGNSTSGMSLGGGVSSSASSDFSKQL